MRWLVGVPIAVALIALLAGSVGLIFAPVWALTGDGAHIGGWHVHTLAQSLVFIPVGLLLLPASILAGALLARPFRSLASSLLAPGSPGPDTATMVSGEGGAMSSAARMERHRNGLRTHAVASSFVLTVLIAVWALTSATYFWPDVGPAGARARARDPRVVRAAGNTRSGWAARSATGPSPVTPASRSRSSCT